MKKSNSKYEPPVILGTVEQRIEWFKVREDREFCEQLYKETTIRLLAFKYAYYVKGETLVKDQTYDNEEQSWYVMGAALGYLKEDETSPCVGWGSGHKWAKEAVQLAESFLKNS